jgi:tetratricopeptide (TPR) repeat protein
VTPLILLLLAQPLPPGHPPGKGAAPSADELIQKLDSTAGLKDREKPFEIAASLGRLYFGQGRYGDAQLYYRQALAHTNEPRVLLAAQRKLVGNKPLPDPASVGCEAKADATLAQLVEKAKAHVAAKNAPSAVACLKVALAASMEVDVMYGNSQFLLGDPAGAIATYSSALDTFEANADARYARAATTLDAYGDDLAALARAKADFEKFLADVPTSPRVGNAKRLLARTEDAIKAGGLSKLTISAEQVAAIAPQQVAAPNAPRQPGQPPQLTPEMMAAFQNAPRTPEMEDNFKKLIADAEEHLARGRFQDALDAYKQVMPYQPDNARLRAGMAWTMVKLNRQPMADNVWNVATQNPDAVAELGDALKAKGDVEGAKALWTRLKDSVPSYAPKLEGRL